MTDWLVGDLESKMMISSLLRKSKECLRSVRVKVCYIFYYYYQFWPLHLRTRVSRRETDKKVLKDSDVDTKSYVMKLAKIDIMKNKRREDKIQMERYHVNKTNIVSENLVVREVANFLSSEGARLCIEKFNKSKITTQCLSPTFLIPKNCW